jgi:hypothetical protein
MLGFISLAQKYRRFLGNAQLTSILARTLRRCLQSFRTIGRLFYRRPALQTHVDCFVPLQRRVADKRSPEAEVIQLDSLQNSRVHRMYSNTKLSSLLLHD